MSQVNVLRLLAIKPFHIVDAFKIKDYYNDYKKIIDFVHSNIDGNRETAKRLINKSMRAGRVTKQLVLTPDGHLYLKAHINYY